ncbi:MAG: hypothetical protein KC505_09050 [Myxococcales bacterium]|nr:hypothetical protein [Myxococcales bacterium]
MMIYSVDISKAKKDISKLPMHVRVLFFNWIDDVEHRGLEEVRKTPGYHDEPLKGKRKGQRSIRLTRAYRAIYVIKKGEVEFAQVEEVNKHDY